MHERALESGVEFTSPNFYSSLFPVTDPSGIQDGAAIRNRQLAKSIALQVVDDEGRVDLDAVGREVTALQAEIASLTPEGHRDFPRHQHALTVLIFLRDRRDIRVRLEEIVGPTSNPMGEELIRDTLELPVRGNINGTAARRAVLSAWLTYLRQNVGSCFATAPAIMIQREQPMQFLADMDELISRGRLTRVIRGFEHVVPLSPSWGQGDLLKPFHFDSNKATLSPGLEAALGKRELPALAKVRVEVTTPRELIGLLAPDREKAERAFKLVTENPLLKGWEFTLASFSESKTKLSRWNIYSALGFNPEEPGGIGSVLIKELNERLERINRQLEELQYAYEGAFAVVKTAESRLRRATAEEANWLKGDYQQRVAEVDKIAQERDRVHARGNRLAGLGNYLIEQYNIEFGNYFQEIYDAQMSDVGPDPYDDAPAGFRLLYKHGRTNPALWDLIHGPEEFIDALADFFVSTETILVADPRLKGLERELSDVVTLLVTHLRTDQFLESALYRMARVHGGRVPERPLENLESVDKKPWAYVSGGTMVELVRNYYRREEPPTMRERIVESPTDLFVFLLEAMKELAPRTSNRFIEEPARSLLIQSPTHAFLFRPGLSPFKEGWLDRGNTYTWVRDLVARPQEDFLAELWLERSAMEQLVAQLRRLLPAGQFEVPSKRCRPRDFRNQVLGGFTSNPIACEIIDGLLYSSLPFLDVSELRGRVEEIFDALLEEPKVALEAFDAMRVPGGAPVLPASALYGVCLASIAVAGGERSATDLPGRLRRLIERLGLAMPRPILFADTNWTQEKFGFLVNPGTGELEMWRSDYLGVQAAPMTRWSSWVDGSGKIPWSIYVNPSEYTPSILPFNAA